MITFPIILGNYAIEIGKQTIDNKEFDVYKINNVHSGVTEAETSSLPRALILVKASNAALEKLLETNDPEDVSLAEEIMDLGEGGVEP